MNREYVGQKNDKKIKFIGIIIWYVISLCVFLLDFITSKNLSVSLYLRPWVTCLVGILLIIGLFMIPVILGVSYCHRIKCKFIARIVHIAMICIGAGIVTIVIMLIWRFNEKSLWNADIVSMEESGKFIKVVQLEWLDEPTSITYEKENLFLAKRISEEKEDGVMVE